MSVLVTGGAGYIGSHMVKLLGQRGFQVTVLDNLCAGHRDAVQGARFVLGDLGERDLLNALFQAEHFDGVMHFARLVLPLGVEREQLHVRWRWRVHGHEDVAQGLRQGSQDAMVAGDELEVERLLQAELVGPLARVGLVGQDFGGETEFGPNRVGPPLSRTVSNTAPDRSAASKDMILPSRS